MKTSNVSQGDKLMTEKQLTDALVSLARQLGYLVCHFRSAVNQRGHWSTPIQGDKGFPDIVIAGRGRVFFFECKREGEKPAPEQWTWLGALKGNIGKADRVVAEVVYPHDLERIAQKLNMPELTITEDED